MERTILRRDERGGALIEALIAMLIVAFGVLGFVGMQARTAVSSLEGYQRMQALVLVNDIAQRIHMNRAAASSYASATLIDPYTYTDPCPTAPGRDRDMCEWAALLRGAAEKEGGNSVGAIAGARACITDLGANSYLVAVVWQGVQASGGTPLLCGQASGAFPQETLRRGVSTVVRIGTLS